jgi:ABC-type branched-subunit amino acid transport system substrate-binding protein
MLYDGQGEPDVLVVAQMAFSGFQKTTNDLLLEVMKKHLADNGWKAGDYKVALQPCNDATTSAGFTDPAKCAQLASQYASNTSIVAIVGFDSSACLQTVTPTLNQSPGGGLALVSTEATFVCLSMPSEAACKPDEPKKYYPSGQQNLFFAIPQDNYTTAAYAQLAENQGYKSVYVLSHDQAYGIGLAALAEAKLKSLGIEVPKNEMWDPQAGSYRALMERVKASGAEALLIAGFPPDNAAQLMKDMGEVLGNDFPSILASPLLNADFLKASGPPANAAAIVVEAQPPSGLAGDRKAFFEELGTETGADTTFFGGFPTFALATIEFTTAAIEASDGTRGSVVSAFREIKLDDSVYGAGVGFNEGGSLTPPPAAGYYSYGPDGLKYEGEVEYSADLADAGL